jgi:hypothetical protein
MPEAERVVAVYQHARVIQALDVMTPAHRGGCRMT